VQKATVIKICKMRDQKRKRCHCQHAGETFKIKGITFMHCQHPKHPRGVSAWETLCNFSDSCKDHELRVELQALIKAEHTEAISIQNLHQDLLETLGEWLNSEAVKIEEAYEGIVAPPIASCELHIKMADAAMAVYIAARKPISRP
jgi:hypothetical protein